jgi:hypothetical protein
MKNVLGSLFVLTMLFSAQGRASGCGNGIQADVREKLGEITVEGVFSCPSVDAQTKLYYCKFEPVKTSIPALEVGWVEVAQLPVVGVTTALKIDVHAALMYNECYGPELSSKSNAYYYITVVNGVPYVSYEYKIEND